MTCIQDPNAHDPICELSGGGHNNLKLSKTEVFGKITEHNKSLTGFSSEPLRLTVKSKNIQNMMFVDMMGIITTKDGNGADNRESIKAILREEMAKPNTQLLVLLEPKEYQTNSVIDFIDESCGSRDWKDQATFLMNKFDLRIQDSRTGSKTNAFFAKFHENGMFPYMVVNPTMDADPDTMSLDEQYAVRQRLLDGAADFENDKFKGWKVRSLAAHSLTVRESVRARTSLPAVCNRRQSMRTTRSTQMIAGCCQRWTR